MAELLIDGTHVKAHRSAAGGKGASGARRSAARAAAARRSSMAWPMSGFALTPGNLADIGMAIPLLDAVPPPRRVIADKAYDADDLLSWLRARHIQAVIPANA
ncbi:transposase, partial [Geminicoccus sp.]|uniref:transposase n=1 Tax=Geminicoccus sp. TaxID=2024832 RepID=UPI002D7EA232